MSFNLHFRDQYTLDPLNNYNYFKLVKALSFLIIVINFCTCTSSGGAPDKPVSVRQVLDHFIVASGGKDRISRITSSRFVLSGIIKQDSIHVRMIKKQPGQLAMMTDYKGERHTTVFSNGKGVEITGGKSAAITEPSYLELLELQSYILPELSVDMRRQRIELTKDTIDAVAYNALTFFSSSGQVLYKNFYHPKTGLLDIQVDRFGNTTYFLDYRFYKGFNIPHTIRVVGEGTQSEMILTDIALDEPVDETMFQ